MHTMAARGGVRTTGRAVGGGAMSMHTATAAQRRRPTTLPRALQLPSLSSSPLAATPASATTTGYGPASIHARTFLTAILQRVVPQAQQQQQQQQQSGYGSAAQSSQQTQPPPPHYTLSLAPSEPGSSLPRGATASDPFYLLRLEHGVVEPTLGQRARLSFRRFIANNLHRWLTFGLALGVYGAACWYNGGELINPLKLLTPDVSSKNKRQASVPTTRLSDVRGCDEAKHEVAEVVEFLKNPEKFNKLGGKMPKGVLLLGPPGTGKTLLARAIAGEAGVPFFSATGADFEQMFIGVGAKRMRELFAEAKKVKPAIIFIDEIDTVGGKRNDFDHPKARMSLNQLLTELDGFVENSGIIVIAATNYAETLDPALLRPGRFDRHVSVPVPDIKGRREILDLYGKKLKLDPSVDLGSIARSTAGMTGADLFHLMNSAALHASALNRAAVTTQDVEYVKDKIMMGAERKSGVNSADIRRHISYYEGGKSLVALLTPDAEPLHKVTILERGTNMGHTAQVRSADDDKTSENYREMLAKLDTKLAGRAAEELVYGPDGVTSHAQKDLQRAGELGRRMVTLLGFGSTLGPVSHSGWSARAVSFEQKLAVDREVQTLLHDSYKRVQEKLKNNEQALHRLAEALLKYEALDAKQIKTVIEGGEV